MLMCVDVSDLRKLPSRQGLISLASRLRPISERRYFSANYEEIQDVVSIP